MEATAASIFEQMPEKERSLLEESRVLKLESDGSDEVLSIARVGMFTGGGKSLSLTSGTVVVTPTRLIVFAQQSCGGGTVVVPYSDIAQITPTGGNKKMFGRYEDVYLLISRVGGGERLQWKIGNDNMWGRQVASAVIEAYSSFALKRS